MLLLENKVSFYRLLKPTTKRTTNLRQWHATIECDNFYAKSIHIFPTIF